MGEESSGISAANQWFSQKGWSSFLFQQECWNHILAGRQGLLNAPTGSGKTLAIFLGFLLRSRLKSKPEKGLKLIWVTPLRALSADIAAAMTEACTTLMPEFRVAVRTGDTGSAERARIKNNPPDVLVTTPESLHLLLASKNTAQTFKCLDMIVVDEWHELLGSKRGVQIELALSRIKSLRPELLVWGISATIGNLPQAADVLLGKRHQACMVQADFQKLPEVIPVIPAEIERFPWAGHLGILMIDRVLEVIHSSESTLVFTNTRSQAEIWYRELLEADPGLAGLIAMHHGSISRDLRTWVEEALHKGQLKAVVCTSSLDLGVDFRPVDSIVQIGSPKGVARFLQRAGRSGHQPEKKSRIWFLPTHTLELIECAALRTAIEEAAIESRRPYINSFDVLVQFLVTLAVSDGFFPDQIFEEIRNTHCFSGISRDEFNRLLDFISTGGEALRAYPDFSRVKAGEDGLWKVTSTRTAMRHRMHIGTIVSDPMLTVKFKRGGSLGHVEEWFVSRLKPGDVFWFGGRPLKLIHIRDMQVIVEKSTDKKGIVPQWMGGRLPLSTELSGGIRRKLDDVHAGKERDEELIALRPLFEVQKQRSLVPSTKQFLIETLTSRDGYHVFFYPFEGRFVHEGLAALFSWRISRLTPITFSIAMNDYGFELLSDQPIPLTEALEEGLMLSSNLDSDIEQSVNFTELGKRIFRDIAAISGLVFQGYPGKQAGAKQLQNSSALMFEVFRKYDPENLLLKQAFDEVSNNQLERERLATALNRINSQELVLVQLDKPSPFAFPILVDRLRGTVSSETLEDRIRKMQVQLEK